MLFFSEDDWQLYGVRQELHRFFVLRWDELFNDETPDTWQIRTSNVLGVLDELVEAIDVAEEHEQSRHNVPVLLDELRAMIHLDPVIPKHFPFVTDYIPAESAQDPSASSSTADQTDFRELRRRLKVIIGQLQNYHKLAINDLRTMLAGAAAKQKEAVYDLAMAVAVGWSVMGYSREHLADISDLIDSSEDDFIRRFDRFVARCDGVKRRYRCRFGLNWPAAIPAPGFRAPDVVLTQGVPARSLTQAEVRFYGKGNPTDVFAEVSVNDLDPVAAYRAAEARLVNVLAALNLYFVQHRLELKGTWALVSDDEQTLSIRIERTREFLLRNKLEAADRVEACLQLLEGNWLTREDRDQMAAALQYHRLALTASTDESRLVNLWIASLASRVICALNSSICSANPFSSRAIARARPERPSAGIRTEKSPARIARIAR